MYTSSGQFGQFGRSSGYTAGSTSTADHFYFRERRGRVDWRLIAPIDVSRLMRDGDIDVLQSLVETLTFADIESEAQHRYADPEFVKIIRICQLAIEYLLHVQDVLDAERKHLRDQSQSHENDMLELNNQLTKSKEEVAMLKRDIHAKKKIINNLEMMMKLPVASSRIPDGRIFKCPLCSKIFATCTYLENHVLRRHPDQANLPIVQTTLANYQNEAVWQNQSDFTKREKEEETQIELRELRDLKEKLLKETDRLSQAERDMKTKLEEQLTMERQTFRKKEDEMERAQMETRLRYEEELRNFQSSMRKELFDHKLQVADQQRKIEEVKPKTSVGMLESDDEGIVRKKTETQIKDAVSKVREDFEKQLVAFKEQAAKEQEQSQLLLQEERKRAAAEKKRALDQVQQEMEKERERVRVEREKAQELERDKERDKEREKERERMQQEMEKEKAQHEMRMKKQLHKQQQLLQQKEQEFQQQKEQQQKELQQQKEQQQLKLQQQKEQQLKKQQLLLQQEEEERKRKVARQKQKQAESARQAELQRQQQLQQQEEEEDEQPVTIQVPQAAKYTPFPMRPYLKALYDHSPHDVEDEHREMVAQLEEAMISMGVPPTTTSLKNKELENHLNNLEEDKRLDIFPLQAQQAMMHDLRQELEEYSSQYFEYRDEDEQERTPPQSRRSSATDSNSIGRRPPPSPTPPSRKLSQQLAQEAVLKKSNLRSSTDSRDGSDNSRPLKTSSSSINLPPSPSPTKKSRTQQGRQEFEEDEDMEEEEGDYYDQEPEEEELPTHKITKPKPQLQKPAPNQHQPLTKQHSQQNHPKQHIQQHQPQPIKKASNKHSFDEDDEFDDDGNDDLVISNSNTSSKYNNHHQDVPTMPDNNPGFRSSTELASFEVSDDDVDEHYNSRRNQSVPKQPQSKNITPPVPSYDKADDFDDDDLDDDIYATPASKTVYNSQAPPPKTTKATTEEDDLSDFLAETEDVLAGAKYGKSNHYKDDAMEKSYDDVAWDEVMDI